MTIEERKQMSSTTLQHVILEHSEKLTIFGVLDV